MKQLWSLDCGPFGHGMIMCEDGLYINLECGGAFRIRGKNLKVKQVKQRVESCLEITVAENVKSAIAEGASGNLSAQMGKVSSGSVENANKNSGTHEK